MASDAGDFTLASAAAGFTLGFGFLCVWNAIQQSRAVRSPLRSAYIYMVWGEIASNLAIGVIGWLFLDGVIKLGYAHRPVYRFETYEQLAYQFFSAFCSVGSSKFSCSCKLLSTEFRFVGFHPCLTGN